MNLLKRSLCLLCAAALLLCGTVAFAAESQSIGLDLYLVIDDTVSMQRNDPNQIATQALNKFANDLPREGSRVGMATYAADILTEMPIIEINGEQAKAQMADYAENGLKQDGHYTDLPSALKYAADQLRQLPESDNLQYIVAVSDGENDFLSDADRQRSDAALEEVVNAGIPCYLIGINNDSGSVEAYLSDVAQRTGGEAFMVSSGDELISVLKELMDRLYGKESEQRVEMDVSTETAWEFPLEDGIFEANLELIHTSELLLRLVGPDGSEIPMDEAHGIVTYQVPGNGELYTTVCMLEPAPGDYTLYLTSADGNVQHVIGEIVLNKEIYVELSTSPADIRPGDGFSVTAKLMRGSEAYTDLAFDSLSAVAEFEGQSVDMSSSSIGFTANLTAPDTEGDYELTVTVRGKTFNRTSDPLTVHVALPAGAAVGPAAAESGGMPWWVWVLIGVGVIALALVVLMVVNNKKVDDYVQLNGSLTVTYYLKNRVYCWEKYVNPGRYCKKRSNHASLSYMLRDLQDGTELDPELDQIFIATKKSGKGSSYREYIQITGRMGEESYTEILEIDNGMGVNDGFASFGGASVAIARLNNGGQVEFSYMH